jgi:hypothetical protein
MGFLDDLVKVALPAVAGTFLGPVAGKALGASGIMGSPFIQSALTSGAIGLLTGQKPKDALKSALLGGLGQSVFGGMGQAGATAGAGAGQSSIDPLQYARNMASDPIALRTGQTSIPQSVVSNAIQSVSKPTAAKTMSGELLQGLGFAGEPGKENMLFKLLNTRMGEGLAAGLVAQLLAGDEEEEDGQGSFERRPYAAGGPGGQLGGINYNQGGVVQYFNQGGAMDNYPANPPRRDGPINPYEGSGTKDDVPALLTAGEFVMTRDAVEGAGGGDVNRGLDRMYRMMDKFEGMA